MNASERKIAYLDGKRGAEVRIEPVPAVRPGTVKVQVSASLISPGTELAQLHQIRRGGEPFEPRAFGYQNAGIITELGPEVIGLSVGQRVACMGGGANHTDIAIVPQNLAMAFPESLSDEQGAFGNLLGTALHAIRRAELQIGENVLVVGMGIVGQLAAQFARLAGARVMVWDTLPQRLQLAARLGADRTVQIGAEDVATAVRDWTEGLGIDAVILAIGGQVPDMLYQLRDVMRLTPDGHQEGRIVAVGGLITTTQWAAAMGNLDVRSAARTGPGYHDDDWEHGRSVYPTSWVRWTTRTNLQLGFRLAAEGRLQLEPLITQRYSLDEVDTAVQQLLDHPNDAMGCVLTMR